MQRNVQIPGRFIDVTFDRHACDHVTEFNLTGLVGQNRNVVGIPLHEGFSLLDARTVGLRND